MSPSPKCTIVVELRHPSAVQNSLRQKGKAPIPQKEYSAVMGRGQAVLHNSKTGGNSGASDLRADGLGGAEPIPAVIGGARKDRIRDLSENYG